MAFQKTSNPNKSSTESFSKSSWPDEFDLELINDSLKLSFSELNFLSKSRVFVLAVLVLSVSFYEYLC